MKYEDIKKKKTGELTKILAEQRAELHGLRLQSSVNQLKNVRQIRKVKRIIARILTEMSVQAKAVGVAPKSE